MSGGWRVWSATGGSAWAPSTAGAITTTDLPSEYMNVPVRLDKNVVHIFKAHITDEDDLLAQAPKTREWNWRVTGWKAAVIGGALCLAPVLTIFGLGFWLGRGTA